MQDIEHYEDQDTPVWAVFGDLMAGMVGALVLLLLGVLGYQMALSQELQTEVAKRETEQQRREVLENALAIPLASGSITLRDGRIGISGSVLFALNSDELQAEGKTLLQSLLKPLQGYLEDRDQLLMVSGFTDDLPIQEGNLHYADNWELSAKRALTVTRALIELGMPADRIFAAAFGQQQPVVSNDDDAGRAQNRRVEMAPVPRATAVNTQLTARGE